MLKEDLCPGEGQLFVLGQIVATPGALALLESVGQRPFLFLARHVTGDFGDLPEEDRRANQRAIKEGTRIISAYPCGDEKVWVITESDRSATTLLLPSEY